MCFGSNLVKCSASKKALSHKRLDPKVEKTLEHCLVMKVVESGGNREKNGCEPGRRNLR
jgi:hypothetical protein